ncbi:interleukin-13 receptor subunit alpha-2 [Protopterus annectens]|uniref:interleukin-13 receptor subunit alpha-2 n=1 Tax=Protopterus annectens TaxID=7888 RepID=UPI001CF9F15C|nr:interleukin-13 receptor subunit alpha-2 [Protopterus annectens]XP_043913397.1 interleukin-13 receptor subunit alpha-2 [Protopterus annectens]XP_043913399.1 interleukin-13 receptor subunit alpha-2 [Protopterus annectens]
MRKSQRSVENICQNLFLFFSMLSQNCSSELLTSVDPPSNLQIIDPGYLGYMHIQWETPVSLRSVRHCIARYKLQYQNLETDRWMTVITKRLSYNQGFDLNKDVKVKVQTLVKGNCTSESELQSAWTEATFSSLLKGDPDSSIEDFTCVYYKWEYMECRWQPGKSVPQHMDYTLFYWHNGLPQTMQCKHYLQTKGMNTGCLFQSSELEDYTSFNICVNGSLKEDLIMAKYFTLETHNLVKPDPPQRFNLNVSQADKIDMDWELPPGMVPPQCLEYEVQITRDYDLWKTKLIQDEMSFTLHKWNPKHSYCFRIRSKVNILCADDGFWSEWSPYQCVKALERTTEIVLGIAAALIGFVLGMISFILLRNKRLKKKGVVVPCSV